MGPHKRTCLLYWVREVLPQCWNTLSRSQGVPAFADSKPEHWGSGPGDLSGWTTKCGRERPPSPVGPPPSGRRARPSAPQGPPPLFLPLIALPKDPGVRLRSGASMAASQRGEGGGGGSRERERRRRRGSGVGGGSQSSCWGPVPGRGARAGRLWPRRRLPRLAPPSSSLPAPPARGARAAARPAPLRSVAPRPHRSHAWHRPPARAPLRPAAPRPPTSLSPASPVNPFGALPRCGVRSSLHPPPSQVSRKREPPS